MRHSPVRLRCIGSGFTLIEVLVALALVSVIMTGVLALTRSTLGFTGLTTSIAASVEDVSQAEGYLADAFRTAKSVYTTEALLASDGVTTLVNCNTTSTGNCIAYLTPVTDLSAVGQPIVDFDLSFINVEPIGTQFADVGIPRGWNGEDTLAMIEYRVENVCFIAGVAPCTAVPTSLSNAQRTFTGQPGFLVGGISATDGSGATVDTFEVASTGTGGSTSLILRLVTRANSSVGQPFTVRETPVELQVSVRGLAE